MLRCQGLIYKLNSVSAVLYITNTGDCVGTKNKDRTPTLSRTVNWAVLEVSHLTTHIKLSLERVCECAVR